MDVGSQTVLAAAASSSASEPAAGGAAGGTSTATAPARTSSKNSHSIPTTTMVQTSAPTMMGAGAGGGAGAPYTTAHATTTTTTTASTSTSTTMNQTTITRTTAASATASSSSSSSSSITLQSAGAVKPACKIVHFIRHAEATHNAAMAEKGRAALDFPEHVDAALTAKGIDQSQALRRALQQHVEDHGKPFQVDVVLVSPLTRALQTMAELFPFAQGRDDDDMGTPGSPWVHNAETTSSSTPPVQAVEMLRERLGQHPCDQRSSVSEVQKSFPGVDFAGCVSDKDTLWKADHRETLAEIVSRGCRIMDMLMRRPEKHIVVVSHSSILMHAMDDEVRAQVADSDVPVRRRLGAMGPLGTRLRNCEMRSLVLSDEGEHITAKPFLHSAKLPPKADSPTAGLGTPKLAT